MEHLRRWQHHEVSRVEGFSDAVFAFALTLLVVALEVPTSFADLVATMQGFIAFAICFGFIVWIWYEHYLFFRRFALEDGVTIALNALLLFVVLFYVYPLKFLFTGLVKAITGLGPARDLGQTFADSRSLMVIYGLGCVAVFLALAALYLHAYRMRAARGFDALETHDVRFGMARHLATAAVATVSIVLALALPPQRLAWAGWIYASLGVVHSVLGSAFGKRRQALAASSVVPTPPAPVPPPSA
jgi:uncharacterized membrane protein